jgi:hypothetical protein
MKPLSPKGYQLASGSTAAQNTIWGSFAQTDDIQVAGKDVVTPVEVTDYEANALEDGSGTDQTANVDVASFTAFGGGFKLVFNNTTGSPVYLTKLQVRGKAVRRRNDERLAIIEATDPILADQVLKLDFRFNDDRADLEAYGVVLAEAYSRLQNRPRVVLLAHTPAEITAALDTELSRRVRIVNTTGIGPTNLDMEGFIEGYELRAGPNFLFEVTWNVLPADAFAFNQDAFLISSDDSSFVGSDIVTDIASEGDEIVF